MSMFCCAQMPSIVKQAFPGVLEKGEICPMGPTEPTMIRLFGGSSPRSHGTFWVCDTPSLPAALTTTRLDSRLLSKGPLRMLTHSLDTVVPGTPSDAFTTWAPS